MDDFGSDIAFHPHLLLACFYLQYFDAIKLTYHCVG
jgi:hypothetical protein